MKNPLQSSSNGIKVIGLLLAASCQTTHQEEPFATLYSISMTIPASGWHSQPDSSALPLSLKEVSGAVAARDFPGCYWAIEDGGNPAALHLIDFSSGVRRLTLNIEGAENKDWEDLTSDGTHLYVGDLGDNEAERNAIQIYRIPEPKADDLLFTTGDTLEWTPNNIQIRSLEYPDGPRDAESLVALPFSDEILIITKRDPEARVYSYSKSPAPTSNESLVFRGSLPHFYSTGAGVWVAPSGDSAWLALRTYSEATFWTLKPGKSWTKSLQNPPKKLPYFRREPQGESVFFWPNGDWSSLSEEVQGIATPPYRYRRKD
jgi:hypothetical protein